MRIRTLDSNSVAEISDWLEISSVVKNQPKLSRARLRAELKNLLALDQNSDEEELEVQVDLLLQELKRRLRICGSSYPFSQDETGMLYSPTEKTRPYLYLLVLSTSQNIRETGKQQTVETLFDYLVADALKNYMGPNALSLRFGWPPDGDRPGDFEKAIIWLSKKMSIPIGKSQKRTASKDGGVDVIVWKPFKDNKIGFAAILAQCTVAIDWPPKSKDIGTDLWRGHLDFGKDPITALAIPFVVPSQFDKWDELSRNVHLVLDRLRLCELLEGITLSNKADFDRWVVDELKSMKQH